MSGKKYLKNKNFHKHNYFDAFKYVVPGHFYEDDREHSPKTDDLVDIIINSNINLANNISSVISIDGATDISGIVPYFVKQNNLTNITTQDFEDNILYPLDKSFKDYTTVESFSSYVTGTLLPSIELNSPSVLDANTLSSNLSWLYFLNTTGTTYDPSAYVADVIVNKLFKGTPVTLADGIKGLMEYVWRNNLTAYYPSTYFASGTRSDLSGTQQLDKLKTWIDVIYSPLFADEGDFRVRDKFQTFIDSNITTTRKVEDGPFVRFLRALSFLAYDIDNLNEKLTTVYDLEDCPDEYLPLLAKLIGWDLFGTDPDKWRLQLRNAVQIYKSVGTKKSIQFALNTVFPKDQFPIQSSLVELWESYVPYLIYYALATESSYFKNYTTWTPNLAAEMGVSGYSTSSMDGNLERATDRIIYETYLAFPDKFNIPNLDKGFHYRGYNHKLPPYEEYPYYVNVELTKEMIDFISDRLVCFGVRNQFAIDVSGYMTEYGLDSNDEPRDGSWLLFTSGYNDPPNYSELVQEANSKKIEYLPLWSGKSSHFKVAINASAYDFTRRGLITTDSGDAANIAFQMIRKFAPAHSIPLASMQVSGSYDTNPLDDPYYLPLVMFNLGEVDVAANNNYWVSGLNLNSYKRDVNTGGNVLSREDTQTLVSPSILNATSLGNLDRRSSRRRSLQNIMPFHGYYDRTGFNMPTTFEMDEDLSGLPLGLIPTKQTFVPVSSHVNLPPVWKQCEDLNSKNSYNDYAVSDTMAARGRTYYSSSVMNDRGQLNDIYASMIRIEERVKFNKFYDQFGPSYIAKQIKELESQPLTTEVEEQLCSLRDDLLLTPEWAWIGSANAYNNSGVAGYEFPATVDDYYNFEFGRDLHNLYRIYIEQFNQHKLSPGELTLDGPNVLSHVFGPLLYNHDFDLLFDDIGSIITSSISDVKELKAGVTPFVTPTSYAASDPNDMYVETPELVFSSLVKGVELIHTSGASDDNSFSVFRVDSSVKKEGDDPYMFDRTFILSRTGEDSTPRVRMDISKWDAGSEYPLNTNFLLPDHDYELNLDALVGDPTGRGLGGRTVGIWIHTKPEGGKMWSFIPGGNSNTPGGEWLHSKPTGEWIQHAAIPKRSDMLQKYAHTFYSTTRTKPIDNPENNFKCLDVAAQQIISPVTKFKKKDFEKYTVKFNTRNRTLLDPVTYKQDYGDIHRKDQEYVVEIFLAPGSLTERFLVFDKVTIMDVTMKKMSERYVRGPKVNPLVELTPQNYKGTEVRVPLSPQDLLSIFKYFNKIAGKGQTTSYASRDANKTETIMGTDGGSKLDYRYKLDWFGPDTQQNNIVRGITIDI